MIPVPYILLYSYLRSIYYFRMRINLTLLKDNDSPSDSDSEPEEGTSFIDIKEYLIMMSLIKPLILSPAKIPEIFILGALFKTRGYYDDEIRI
jgi:hypothetical protein